MDRMPEMPLAEWMKALDAEARRRGCWLKPLADDVLEDGGCWVSDYREGLTPGGALDRDFGAKSEEMLESGR